VRADGIGCRAWAPALQGNGIADFRGVLGITKKEFFITLKSMVFLHFLKIAGKRWLQSIKTGVW
jgi:hypothetical protein